MSDVDLKKVYRWQCRRGLKEIEVALNDYLDRFFETDPEAMRIQFGRLLQEQDADMFEWFTGRSLPQDTDLAEFIPYMLERCRRPH